MNIIKDIEIAMFDVLNSDRYSTFQQYYYNNPKQEEELLVRIYNLIKKKGERIDFANYAIEKKEGNITSSGAKRQIYLLGNSEKEIECAIIFKLLSNKLKRYVNKHMVSRDTQIEILIEKLKVPNIKQIYSCDITDFYGSIDHGKLKEIVSSKLDLQVYIDLFNDYLDFSSDLLTEVGDIQQNVLSKSLLEEKNKRGLPQGISPSNLLAELYAINIKNKMEIILLKAEINASVYRYADDFRIIFSDNGKGNKIVEIIQKIEQEIEQEFHINFRKFKPATSSIQSVAVPEKEKGKIKGELTVWWKNECFDYLGYKFIHTEKQENGILKKKLDLQVSEKKIEKIKEKVIFALERFNSLYIDYSNNVLTSKEFESQIERYEKIFLERIRDIVSVKIFKKGKHTIHTGVAYTYKKITCEEQGATDRKTITFKVDGACDFKENVEKIKDDSFIKVKKSKITLELLPNQKLFYIDKPNYISKHKLILTLIDLDYTNKYTYQNLRDKTYYEVYSLYQGILWNKKTPL